MSEPYLVARDRYYRQACTRCGAVRTANPYQRERSGLCRACSELARLEARKTDTLAFCSECEQWKPHEAFYVTSTSRGLAYRCKVCVRASRRKG